MSGLAEFLLARIAEDEAAARAAGDLEVLRGDDYRILLAQRGGDLLLATSDVDERLVRWWGHVAAHMPARVLAECEAKRKIVEAHHFGPGYRQREMWEPEWPEAEYMYDVCGSCYALDEDDCPSNAPAPCLTIRTLAAIYADHPDYQEDWRA